VAGQGRGCRPDRHEPGTGPSHRRRYVASTANGGGDVNVVTLIGNLASDVQLKEIGEGKRVASFLLAVDRPSADGGADFVQVAVWDRQAETCAQYLAKGRRVALDGHLRSRSWEEEGKR